MTILIKQATRVTNPLLILAPNNGACHYMLLPLQACVYMKILMHSRHQLYECYLPHIKAYIKLLYATFYITWITCILISFHLYTACIMILPYVPILLYIQPLWLPVNKCFDYTSHYLWHYITGLGSNNIIHTSVKPAMGRA